MLERLGVYVSGAEFLYLSYARTDWTCFSAYVFVALFLCVCVCVCVCVCLDGSLSSGSVDEAG